jgi:hypothetical protein
MARLCDKGAEEGEAKKTAAQMIGGRFLERWPAGERDLNLDPFAVGGMTASTSPTPAEALCSANEKGHLSGSLGYELGKG